MVFKPGVSGNPHGRPPKGFSKADMWRRKVDEIDPETGKTKYELFIEKTIEKALAGDEKAGDRMAAYTEGKPAQSVSISTEERMVDYSKFTDGQLKQLEDLQNAAGVTEEENESNIIDGQIGVASGEVTP